MLNYLQNGKIIDIGKEAIKKSLSRKRNIINNNTTRKIEETIKI